jgi:hypothetical protein
VVVHFYKVVQLPNAPVRFQNMKKIWKIKKRSPVIAHSFTKKQIAIFSVPIGLLPLATKRITRSQYPNLPQAQAVMPALSENNNCFQV